MKRSIQAIENLAKLWEGKCIIESRVRYGLTQYRVLGDYGTWWWSEYGAVLAVKKYNESAKTQEVQ